MRRSDPRDRLYTAEEYGRLPDYPDCRDELVRGRRIREPFPRPIHGHLQARIGGLLDGFVREHGPGYVAVETRFTADRPGRLAEKIAQYYAAGTRLVWVIDPRERSAVVYRGPDAARVLGAEGKLEGEDVIPGFRCPIRELFD